MACIDRRTVHNGSGCRVKIRISTNDMRRLSSELQRNLLQTIAKSSNLLTNPCGSRKRYHVDRRAFANPLTYGGSVTSNDVYYAVRKSSLQKQFTEAQLVEITALLTAVNLNRFNAAFRIGSAGFSDGMVCVPPDRPADGASLATTA